MPAPRRTLIISAALAAALLIPGGCNRKTADEATATHKAGPPALGAVNEAPGKPDAAAVPETAQEPASPDAVAGLEVAATATSDTTAPDAATQARTVVLVAPEELAELQARLDAQVKANQERQCLRPVLRGESVEGRADEDIIAVVEGETFKPCYDLIKEVADPIAKYLENPTKETPPELAKVHELCHPLLEAVQKAINHEDACSPYLAGRRGLPSMIPTIRAGKAMAFLLLEELLRGTPENALNIGLDWLRFSQDTVRGRGAPLIGAMVSVAATKYVLDAMRFALNQPNGMTPEMLERMAKELGTLLETEPGFGDFLPYENYGLALHMLLPAVKGPAWVPPGGFDHDRVDPSQVLGEGKDLEGVSEDQQMALLWVAMDGNGRRMEEACPKNALAAACHAGLLASARDAARDAGEERFLRTLKVMASDQPDKEIRAWILDIIKSIATPAFNKYVIRFSHRAFRISALRGHAALRARLDGNTEIGEELTKPEWRDYLTDPATGGTMRFLSTETGKVTLQPAVAFEGAGAQDYRELAHEIILPTRALR